MSGLGPALYQVALASFACTLVLEHRIQVPSRATPKDGSWYSDLLSEGK